MKCIEHVSYQVPGPSIMDMVVNSGVNVIHYVPDRCVRRCSSVSISYTASCTPACIMITRIKVTALEFSVNIYIH